MEINSTGFGKTAEHNAPHFRLPFDGMRSLERNFSQAGQDLFVLSLLNGKRNGVFLDLGCNHPVLINNTFLLESSFGWWGLSVDIDQEILEMYRFCRGSKAMAADCTNLDWDEIFGILGTTRIDYLSLDLEPPASTLQCLRSIPFDRVEFSVITFEHDAYRSGDELRNASRKILSDSGYTRVCSNVFAEGLEFEDWYCNPKFVDMDRLAKLECDHKDWKNIVFQ